MIRVLVAIAAVGAVAGAAVGTAPAATVASPYTNSPECRYQQPYPDSQMDICRGSGTTPSGSVDDSACATGVLGAPCTFVCGLCRLHTGVVHLLPRRANARRRRSLGVPGRVG
jgi:hypothetical protein